MNVESVGDLILQELKLIRKEMKEEIDRLCYSIQFLHFEKAAKIALNANQDVFNHHENPLILVNKVNNQRYQEKTHRSLDWNGIFFDSETNPNTNECEFPSFNSKQLQVPSNLSESEIPNYNESTAFSNQFAGRETNEICEIAERDIKSTYPVIVEVKSVCESKSRLNEISFDQSCTNFKKNEESDRNAIIGLFDTFGNFDGKYLANECLAKTDIDKSSNHQPYNENNFQCVFCSRLFSSFSDYFVHVRNHTGGEKVEYYLSNYISEFAENQSFDKEKKLTNKEKHISKHNKKVSSLSCKLNMHKRIRLNKTLYKCKLCDKILSCKSSLIHHTAIHTGERPHACDVCNKRFVTKFGLSRHYRIHTGEKPFECTLCGKRFTYNRSKRTHFFTHHAEKMSALLMH